MSNKTFLPFDWILSEKGHRKDAGSNLIYNQWFLSNLNIFFHVFYNVYLFMYMYLFCHVLQTRLYDEVIKQ